MPNDFQVCAEKLSGASNVRSVHADFTSMGTSFLSFRIRKPISITGFPLALYSTYRRLSDASRTLYENLRAVKGSKSQKYRGTMRESNLRDNQR